MSVPAAQCPPSQARNIYSESKTRLCERIAANIQSCGSVVRQIVKGSKSSDILVTSAKSFAAHETVTVIESTSTNINRLEISSKQFGMQLEEINKSCQKIEEVVQKIS